MGIKPPPDRPWALVLRWPEFAGWVGKHVDSALRRAAVMALGESGEAASLGTGRTPVVVWRRLSRLCEDLAGDPDERVTLGARELHECLAGINCVLHPA